MVVAHVDDICSDRNLILTEWQKNPVYILGQNYRHGNNMLTEFGLFLVSFCCP